MNIVNVEEDGKYYAVEIEKADFLNSKKYIDNTYNGAVLTFINSSAKTVFYKKEDNVRR